MRSPYVFLRHDEARDRSALLEVTGYDVPLGLAADERIFTSLTAISLDGTALPTDALHRGRYPLRLPAGEHELSVSATMPFRNDSEGLHAYTDPADGCRYVYGMSFLDAALTVFGCFDQPDLKAPYTLHVLPLAPNGSTERVRSAVETHLDRAEEGTERQLTAFRVLLRLSEDAARVRAWLTRLPRGLDLDRDLRWRLLHRLAVLGATDRAELDAALADDPGGGAPVDHARAVAALPEPFAKQWAWEHLTGAAEASNQQVQAAGLGLWHPEQTAVVAAAERLPAENGLDRVVRLKMADLTDLHRRLLAVPR